MLKYNKKENYEIYDIVINQLIFFYHLKTLNPINYLTLKNFDLKFVLKKASIQINRVESFPSGTLAKDYVIFKLCDYSLGTELHNNFFINNINLDFIEKTSIIKSSYETNFKPDFRKILFLIKIDKKEKCITISKNEDSIKFYYNSKNDLIEKLNKIFYKSFNLEENYFCDIYNFNSNSLKYREIIEY